MEPSQEVYGAAGHRGVLRRVCICMQVLTSLRPFGLGAVDCNGNETSLLECSAIKSSIRGSEVILACANLSDSASAAPMHACPVSSCL